MAGVDPTDNHPGVPPIDSIDQWKTILTANANWTDGARQELVLAYGCTGEPGSPSVPAKSCPDGRGANDSALIQKQYKVVFGPQNNGGWVMRSV